MSDDTSNFSLQGFPVPGEFDTVSALKYKEPDLNDDSPDKKEKVFISREVFDNLALLAAREEYENVDEAAEDILSAFLAFSEEVDALDEGDSSVQLSFDFIGDGEISSEVKGENDDGCTGDC